MADTSDGCLHRPGREKTAGATLYLMEELGDARLRCDQLLRYLDEAVKLIEKSSHKDHFFEVAGHLITSIPDVAFRLQKALQAVALAADRIDYEEIKQELRPEKVDELERVLKDVRIRPVQHRSVPPVPGGVGAIPMTPKQAATRLREIAKTAREEGSIPLNELATLVHSLDPKRQAADASSPVAMLEKLADHLEQNTKQTVSRTQLATVLARIGMEAEFNESLRHAAKRTVKQALAADTSINGNFENIKGHAIAAARAASSGRWRPALMSLVFIVDEIGTVLVHLGSMDTQKSEALKREIRQMLPGAAKTIEEQGGGEAPLMMTAEWKATYANSSEEARRSRFEQGKPADPTENMDPEDAKEWKVKHEENKDNFKAAGEDDDKKSKFEEGKPADPTENMSPEDAKAWKVEHQKNKDNFKAA